MAGLTADRLAEALLRGPITPLRLRKFVRLARLVSPAERAAALTAIPDPPRTEVVAALQAAGVDPYGPH